MSFPNDSLAPNKTTAVWSNHQRRSEHLQCCRMSNTTKLFLPLFISSLETVTFKLQLQLWNDRKFAFRKHIVQGFATTAV